MGHDEGLDVLNLTYARQLVEKLEAGKFEEADHMLNEMMRMREGYLFNELGKLTRELHDALSGFREDSRLQKLMQSEIPDAKERLNYVVTLTEQAAHRTLNSVEESLPIANNLSERAIELHGQWQRFLHKDTSVEDVSVLAGEADEFLQRVGKDSKHLHSNLSDVLMAQDYQDITGQVIRRVIDLVQDVEQGLVGMIRLSGDRMISAGQKQAENRHNGYGPAVPGVTDVEAQADVMKGQDDVDDLLSTLGF